MKKHILYYLAIMLIFLSSCEDTLEEEVYSSITTNSYFNSEQDYTLALYGAYNGLKPSWGYYHKYYHVANDSPSEMLVVDQPWAQGEYGVTIDFTWTSSTGYFGWTMYNPGFSTISKANLVIDETSKATVLSEGIQKRIIAEAKFLRALCYYDMSGWFGGLSLVTTSDIDPLSLPARNSYEEVVTQVEKDLIEAVDDLPVSVPSSEWGRPTIGAANALLCKLYLRDKQWEKAKNMASDVINGPYSLQETYGKVFAIDNEQNNEIVFAVNNVTPDNQGNGNLFNVHALPNDYPGINSWSGFRATNELYNYFEEGDHRRDYLIYDYESKSGEIKHSENPFVTKFQLDPNQEGSRGTNDELVLRLADIILCKAEAINEISGPTQEAIDLVNQVRERAFENSDNSLTLADLPTKEAFRDYLLYERARELYHEGKRREDLIRFGKFIEFAKNRGATHADNHHLLYPIPQGAINKNGKLEQNPGY